MKQEPKALTENNLSPSAPVPPDRQKAISLTAGTLAFFAACLFLIAGLCRFSFYVLKNHRNAVDKDAFVKTYVDVQPYNGFKNADYIALDSFKNGAPAVFFDKTHSSAKNTKPAKKQNSVPPLPVYASATAKPAEHEPPLRAVPARRLAPAVKAPISVAAVSVKKEKIPDNAVSLDELIISGTKILDDGDEKIADAAEIEDAFAFDIAKAELFEPKEEKKHVPDLPADVADPDKPPFTPAIRKKSPAKTVWIDVAALRRSLKEQENSALKILAAADKKEAIKKENDALLKMGGAKQIASLKNETASDTELNVSKDATKTEKSKTSVAETRLPLKAVGKKEDENVKKAVRSKVAQAQKKTNDSFVQTENLWKIAVANGTPKNKLAVKKPEPENEKIIAIKNLAREEADNNSPSEEYIEVKNTAPSSETVIYRNGRPHKIFNKADESESKNTETANRKNNTPLDWMDRQQAAVWTSMAQSDTPSVWTLSSNDTPHNPEAAKAFKVADVSEPAPEKTTENEKDNVLTSAEVRVVGEEKKPEAKKSPLLLPLGSSTPVSTSSPLPAASMPSSFSAPSAPAPALVHALPPPASFEQDEQSEQGDDSIVGKIKSLFSSSDAAPALPDLGSGSSSSLPDLNRKSATSKKSSSGRKNSKKSASIGREDAFSTMERNAKRNTENELPAELRLTFKPGNAELTSTSVKWVKAFGNRAKKDIQRGIEVRMSNQIRDIQEKRFAIIRSILLGTGMEPTQLFPVMTNRTPHTIVLRAFDIPEEGYEEYTSSGNGVEERIYFRQW